MSKEMKEQSLEELKKEIKSLKLQKEKELLLATTMKEKEELMSEIAMLKKAQQKPSAFKQGLKTFGKGLGTTWKYIQKASRNLENNDANLKRVAMAKRNPRQVYSQEAMMYLPRVKPMKMKKGKKVKTKVKTYPKQPRTKVVTRTIKNKYSPSGLMPWDLA